MTQKFDRKSKVGGLIINRNVGDKISINNGELRIEIVEIKGKQVRLAFKASKEISIQREELAPFGFEDDGTPELS